MAFTKDKEAKKACYKILSDLPQDDTNTLVTKIAAIEAFPDNKVVFVKSAMDREDGIPGRKVCTDCKFKGHTAAECWGKCQHCGKYGHKSQVCRTKAKQDQIETLKKAAEEIKKQKLKKKNGKKENAKRVAELVQAMKIDSPDTSSGDETSSDSSDSEASSPNMAVKTVQETTQSRREAQAN